MSYQIRTLDKAPAMTETTVEFVGSYDDAVAAAVESFKLTRRSTSVVESMYYLFRIDSDGNYTDKNTKGGAAYKTGKV